MTENEILAYYDENWNDYNKIVDMLHNIIDNHSDEITILKNDLTYTMDESENEKIIKKLQKQLLECQDLLDEERHNLT